ncbi:MAG: hypothetical protein P8Y44_01115 [Acidobacteriota bacterium]
MTATNSESIELVERQIEQGSNQALYLIAGDRVLAEPGAMRIAKSLSLKTNCDIEVHVRPVSIVSILADLKTYSLFAPAKVVVAIETALLADESAAADLIDEVLEALPLDSGDPEALSDKERRAASQLLHTLRLFRVDPFAGSTQSAVAQIPRSAIEGGKASGRKRKRDSRQIGTARDHLGALLEVARLSDLEGRADTDVGELVEIVERGLPEGHSLVLAESAIASEHPLIDALKELGCFASVGRLQTSKKGDWQGLDLLATQLERETGVGMSQRALEELARRTLQSERSRTKDGSSSVQADSSARLAAEYRKLAMLSERGKIGIELVESTVEDRGQEDAWKTLDAIGAGRSEEALERIHRLLVSSDDVLAERLSFFSLLASFCRQLAALSKAIDRAGITRRQTSYNNFKSQIAPQLQAELPGGGKNPLGGLHPYRLYRAYSVACRMPASILATLPARVLETELRLKGDSDLPDAALSSLVCDLTTAFGKAS